MKKVEGMVVVEVTEILTGIIDGKSLAQVKKKKVELPESKLASKLEKYKDLSDLPSDIQAEGARSLGACYEKFNSKGVREIYGEEELIAMSNELIAKQKADNAEKKRQEEEEADKLAKDKADKEAKQKAKDSKKVEKEKVDNPADSDSISSDATNQE